MLDIIIKGLFIGFLSSAPMGPVGMLCVQRTLNDGRKSGLLTGVGAATGDITIALIAMLAALGLGFSTDLIQEHQWPLQIIGSLILIIFGAIVFRKNPTRNIIKEKEKKTSNWKLFVSSLMLTISNIATLFLYIALFARFNIINATNPLSYDFLGIACIGIGAMSWWLIITYFVNKLRKVFNLRGLKIFNKLIGGILIGVGILGIFAAIASVDIFS